MIQNELFFKRKKTINTDVELIFHRDYTWNYNNALLPVVRYILPGCKNIDGLNWELLTADIDGVIISSFSIGDRYVFQTTDIGGNKFEVNCERIIQEEKTYDIEDLTDLIKETCRQLDGETAHIKKLQDKIQDITLHLEKELNSNSRKLNQADWLTGDKKQFIQGQNTIIEYVLNRLKAN